MVIDDEPIVGNRLKRMLEKEGYAVEKYTEGSTALEALKKQHFDIIITDLKMEGIDGMNILETAKEINPHIKTIIITGFGTKKTAKEALNHGAYSFISKPFKIQELKQVIKKAESELMKNKNIT
jgi:DNA-binding NtrC family response regulator